MKLEGNRIHLTPLDQSDEALFIEIAMCPVMMEHVYSPFTYEEAKAAFRIKSQPWSMDSTQWLTLGIAHKESGEKLGSIGIKIVNHDAGTAEVGFMLKQSAQGQGYASEALSLIKSLAFDTLRLNKLAAFCSTNNVGSYKLLEKQGFLREGHLKQHTLLNGCYVDYIYMVYARQTDSIDSRVKGNAEVSEQGEPQPIELSWPKPSMSNLSSA